MSHNKHGSHSPFQSKHLYLGSPMIHSMQSKVLMRQNIIITEIAALQHTPDSALRSCHQYLPQEPALHKPDEQAIRVSVLPRK